MSSLEQLDINVLPLNTPLLLLTTEGVLLKDCSMFPLIELQPAQGGVVKIRRSGSPRRFTGSSFDAEYTGAEFTPLLAPNGTVVFKSHRSTKGCLTTSAPGPNQDVHSSVDYEGKWQEWQLLKPVRPAGLRINDLAAASLSDSNARRQLVWYLFEAGNSSETVAEILTLLYGLAQVQGVDVNSDLHVAEHQEQALLKLIKPYSSIESIRAKMALVHAINLASPSEHPAINLAIKSEHATVDAQYAANGDSPSEYGDQYVQVDHPSEKFADFDAIPAISPLVMVSLTGSTLNTSETGSCFVELNCDKDDGLVTIHSADDKTKCLVLNAWLQCVFGGADNALKFKMEPSATGRLLLVEHLSGCVLEMEKQGEKDLVVCRNLYSTEMQSWLLFTPHTLAPSLRPSTLQKPKHSNDARRQLIMELALARNSSSEVGEAVKLLYGSTLPADTREATNAMRVERLQQILTLLCGKVPTHTIGDFLWMMYGTSAPL